jgi:hypothetical protein
MWQIPHNIIEKADMNELIVYILFQLKESDAVSRRIDTIKQEFDKQGNVVFDFKDGKIYEGFYYPHRVEGFIVGRVWSFRDITKRKQYEDTLFRLNKMFVSLGSDSIENIQMLTQACGEFLDAAISLYARIDAERVMRCANAWRVPVEPGEIECGQGTVCYDLMAAAAKSKMTVVKDLPNTGYYSADQLVSLIGAKTYIGHIVESKGKAVGVLCLLYQRDLAFDDNAKMILEILAKAIGIEEDRKVSDEQLKKKMKDLERFNQFAIDRELRMIELKKQLRECSRLAQSGAEPEQRQDTNES